LSEFNTPVLAGTQPCERVFEWLRGQIEGEVYASLKHKRWVIDRLLRRLNTNKGLLNSLIGWQWIQDGFAQACDP
jgi:hypothetical protein